MKHLRPSKITLILQYCCCRQDSSVSCPKMCRQVITRILEYFAESYFQFLVQYENLACFGFPSISLLNQLEGLADMGVLRWLDPYVSRRVRCTCNADINLCVIYHVSKNLGASLLVWQEIFCKICVFIHVPVKPIASQNKQLMVREHRISRNNQKHMF